MEEVARGAAVSLDVAVVGFPGVEPYDKFLIEPIEESEELELESLLESLLELELELLAFLFFMSWRIKFS